MNEAALSAQERGFRERYHGPDDVEAAAPWYRRIVRDGDPAGLYYLGVMHCLGLGVRRDILEGFVCLEVAAISGDIAAPRLRDEVRPLLSLAQLHVAQVRVGRLLEQTTVS